MTRSAGFEPAQIENMFEHFRNYNIAARSYSADWDEVWCAWVCRQVDFVQEWHDRERARAYFERRAA